jgi:hypothetical protein
VGLVSSWCLYFCGLFLVLLFLFVYQVCAAVCVPLLCVSKLTPFALLLSASFVVLYIVLCCLALIFVLTLWCVFCIMCFGMLCVGWMFAVTVSWMLNAVAVL